MASGTSCDADSNGATRDVCLAFQCVASQCGDAYKDVGAGEACDDGNTAGGDGCSADCTSNETCGNSVVDASKNEVCDDGNTVDGDTCKSDCSAVTTPSCEPNCVTPPTAYRFTEVILADPHLFVKPPFSTCKDITDVGFTLFGQTVVPLNAQLAASLNDRTRLRMDILTSICSRCSVR